MADRNVTVRLRAEVADFNRSMSEATRTVDKTSAAFDAQGQKIQTVSGRMVRSAEVNRQAWTTTGVALGAVAAGFGAVAASIARTGIEYNTLQQTSRAALTTLLGGAEAANAQMDELDEFARTSPFAKQVFINAQRQMLGFGVETAKVLPYLDAVQNAVAAMGGSNQEISEISNIMAKIASQGKITARELMQLGIHGVDAAQLIGSQMDMTAGQIRESITAGSIDAQTALDALAAGMQERFGGAAENVKNTYEGAIDRVKAAWRDLASDLMTPLIDPEGGGVLVDLANNLADLLRWFEALPEPVKNAVVALGGLTGTTLAVAAGFLLIFPRVMDAVAGFRALSEVSPRATAGLRNFTKGGLLVAGVVAGFAAITAAVEAIPSASQKGTTSVATLTRALLDMQEVGGNLQGAFGFTDDNFGLTGAVDDLTEAARRITDPSLLDRMYDVGGSIRGILGSGDTSRTQAIDEIEAIGGALAGLVQSGQADRAAEQFEMLAWQWRAGGGSVDELRGYMTAYTDALANVDNEQRLAGESTGDLTASEERLADVQERVTSAQEKLTDARAAYRDEVSQWRESTMGAFASFMDNQGAFDSVVQANIAAATEHANKVNEANAEWARQQEGNVSRATVTWEDYYDGITVSASDYIDELQRQVDAQSAWADNISTINERLSDTFSGDDLTVARENLESMIQSGDMSAGLLDTLAGASDSELAEIVDLWRQGGEDAGYEFTNELVRSMDPFVELRLDMSLAQTTLDQWKRQEVVLEVDIEPSRTGFIGQLLDDIEGRWSGFPTADGFRDGGPIHGPGTSTSDSIPIWSSDGEYMQPAAAHSFWGTRAMESIRKRDVAGLWRELGARGFRDGGAITAAAAAPQIVTVPVESRYEEHAPLHMTVNGPSAFQDAMDYAERRRNSVLGGR